MFREAADLAYYFHWPRAEIMAMTRRERRDWLAQINRIHTEQKKQRDRELVEQVEQIYALRQKEIEY
ncbi:MAG: GpE family phage tail protein [Treponema sp.]|nr:GpE family phage tail protein [Treponema sp.]